MVITTKEDPVIHEITTTLREWHQIWISLYLDNQCDLFERIGNSLEALIEARLDLINLLELIDCSQDTIAREQQIVDLKSKIVAQLDGGNRLLGLDLVLRDSNFRLIDPVELSPVRLYQLHSDVSTSETPSISNTNSNGCYYESLASTTGSSYFTISQTGSDQSVYTTSSQNQNSYHLQLSLKKYCLASLPPDELVEIYISIIEASSSNNNSLQISPVTEKFLIQIKNDKLSHGVPSTVFADIGPIVTNRNLGILVQIYRVGRMMLADGLKTTFGRQQSNCNMMPTSDGSINSIGTTILKNSSNGLARSRHSTIGDFSYAQPTYRRPFGTSFISLKDRANLYEETTLSTKVYTTSNESEFSQLNEIYPKKNQLKLNQTLPNVQLDMTIRFLSCRQETIPKIITLNSYCVTEKRGFPDIVMPGDFKNDLHFTLESAEFEKGGKSISKNIEASISLIGKTRLPIEKCIVPASNCDEVSSYKSCVFYHSNTPRWGESFKIKVPLSDFDSAHIRIEFRHCSTKDREKKFLGFSFLPLSDEDGTVIQDRSHELYLYKCDSQSWAEESQTLRQYTNLPYGPAAKIQALRSGGQQVFFSHSNREIVTVSTYLLSTKLTQNSNLLNLLKWRELVKRNNKDFEEALKKVLVLKGEEIVKFLQDILDTLFDTFTLYSSSEDDYCALIFKVMVHIFLLLDEPRYQHFKPVLDNYVSAHFSATLVHKGLMVCVKRCLSCSSIVERHGPIQKCFRSIKYVFQFIVQSKLLYAKATGTEHNDELFLKDLRHLFESFETLLASDNPRLIPIQETFLQSFPGTLGPLAEVMSSQELVKVVTSFAGSVGFCLPPPLLRAKLIFMREIANCSLNNDRPENQEVRQQITKNFCCHLYRHIHHSEELELCHEVLETLVVKVHDFHWPTIYRLYQLTLNDAQQQHNDDGTTRTNSTSNRVMTVGEINSHVKVGEIQANQLDLAIINIARDLEPLVDLMEPMLKLLDMLVQDFNSDRPIIQKYCTCLLTVLKLMGKSSFEQYMNKQHNEERHLEYLTDVNKLCNIFKSLRAVYNRDWSIMQLTSHAILEHPINEIFKNIKLRSDTQPPNNRQLSSYINLIVDFITHPTLQLEAFSERKKDYVLKTFSDLRLKFSKQLIRFWHDLTKANICDLIPASMQPFLDAALLPNDELQQQLIPIFWDMIDAEDQAKSNNLRQIERYLVDNLDLFMNLDRGSSRFIENFDEILKRLIRDRSPAWEQRGLKLINRFSKLMHLLYNYRQSLESCDNRSKQMSCLVELLDFYKDQSRMDIYLKYLFKLCDMHLESGNHTEAALTLKLYADELHWYNRNLSALDGFRPDEQEWARKEVLYHRCIQHFDSGKCWEESIGLCKELASFYENFLIDYEKVSETLKRLAQFLDNILTEHRPEREYFRVEFIGSDLPDYVRGKELIYRGGEYERLAAFIQRITADFPDAQVLNSKSKQTLTKNCSGQYLIISNVKPVPFLQDHFKSGQRCVNDKIIQYYLNNRLDTFSYDLPIVKSCPTIIKNNTHTATAGTAANKPDNNKSGGCEVNVRNLWVGRYILKVKRQLPDILPWSEVVSQEYIEISPINHAIETISAMNLELSKLILSYKSEPNKQISPLTMRLQGVLEAAVNGGPAVIVNAFFKRNTISSGELNNEQANNHQYHQESLVKLRDLIRQQFSILETGLGLHSKLAPPEVMPLHARLVERLVTMKKTLLEDTSQIENTYEIVNHSIGVSVTAASGPIQCTSANSESQSPLLPPANSVITMSASQARQETSASKCDEVDGKHGLSVAGAAGSNYLSARLEDQIYSQPNLESHLVLPSRPVAGNGTRSELTSPSRHQYTSGPSSSLSTLAVLSNLPINRTRVSLTPSKELSASTALPSSSQREANDMGGHRPARRLTYDSSQRSIPQEINLTKMLPLRLPTPQSNGATPGAHSSSNQAEVAPPLPPRQYPLDRNQGQQVVSVALSRSPLIPNRTSSPHYFAQQQQQQQRAAANNRL